MLFDGAGNAPGGGQPMTDEEFKKKLEQLDKGMADAWKKETGGTLKAEINEVRVSRILGWAFSAKKITAPQAEAIRLFWDNANQRFTRRASVLFYMLIEGAYASDFFFAGSAAQLASADQIKQFRAVMTSNTGKIKFTSPGTRITYSPDQYLAIAQLVADGKITVFDVDAAALNSLSGTYESGIDRLIIYKGFGPSLMKWTIVHEVTHAIQDWQDIVSKVKFTEADAFIAAAMTGVGANGVIAPDAVIEFPEEKAAAGLVFDGKAVLSNKDWTKAYAAVVKAVEKSGRYSRIKNRPFKPSKDERGKNEKAILADTLRRIKAASP
jgi:hypothetical protein